MFNINISSFQGRVPRLSNKLLQNEQAQIATNVDLRDGNLQPLEDVLQTADQSALRLVRLAGTITDITDFALTVPATVPL